MIRTKVLTAENAEDPEKENSALHDETAPYNSLSSSIEERAGVRSRKYYFDGGQVEIAAELVHELDADGNQLRVVKLTIEQLRFQANRIAELRDLQIQAPWSPLTRLKGGNPQAFHYWYQAQRILTGE